MATLHVRIPDEMNRELQRLVQLSPHEHASAYVRSLIRAEIIASQEENGNDSVKLGRQPKQPNQNKHTYS